MARNSRKNGLNHLDCEKIFINGKPVLKSLVRENWTNLAKECYKRNCICSGCDLVPKLDSPNWKCRIKDYVMAYIKQGIYPKDNEGHYGRTDINID